MSSEDGALVEIEKRSMRQWVPDKKLHFQQGEHGNCHSLNFLCFHLALRTYMEYLLSLAVVKEQKNPPLAHSVYFIPFSQ